MAKSEEELTFVSDGEADMTVTQNTCQFCAEEKPLERCYADTRADGKPIMACYDCHKATCVREMGCAPNVPSNPTYNVAGNYDILGEV